MEKVDINIIKSFADGEEQNVKKLKGILLDIYELIYPEIYNKCT